MPQAVLRSRWVATRALNRSRLGGPLAPPGWQLAVEGPCCGHSGCVVLGLQTVSMTNAGRYGHEHANRREHPSRSLSRHHRHHDADSLSPLQKCQES